MKGKLESRPLRIAAISEQLDLGGSTTFLINLGASLKEQAGVASFTVYNISPRHPLASSFQYSGVQVAPLPPIDIFENRISHVLRHLVEQKPDIVIASLGTLALECLRYIPRGVTRYAVVHTHTPITYDTIRPYIDLLDGLVVVSPEMLRHVQSDTSFAHIPLYCIPYGVDVPKRNMPTRPIDPSCLHLLYIGRLDRGQKRVHLFPEIWDRLKNELPACQWTIAGDGPEAPFLKSHLLQDRQHTITFTGSVSYDQTGALMEKHDIYLLASESEGLPLSLLEAMGRGVVPVVSDLASGIRECVTPECGIKVVPSRTDQYVREIIALFRNPEKMHSMSASAIEQARRNYSRELMATRWMELFTGKQSEERWEFPDHIKPIHSQSNRRWLSPQLRPLRRMAYRISNLMKKKYD